jgi:hypothetical protein
MFEKNQSYTIIAEMAINKNESIVIGESLISPSPYVVWNKYRRSDGMVFENGYYCNEKETAFDVFSKRLDMKQTAFD